MAPFGRRRGTWVGILPEALLATYPAAPVNAANHGQECGHTHWTRAVTLPYIGCLLSSGRHRLPIECTFHGEKLDIGGLCCLFWTPVAILTICLPKWLASCPDTA
jgi:hypothetical protein